ncbi:hypothetical protein BLNAU_4944 [Blattamonas nauphoetae]|uniref:Uncharacterized protein n=1 Tax=Blattamonas nauphoetae TaxID=2049346 RepID=A0ABQ9Y8I5_9EUKA|nr:hypothetical protein BLNAU_4944 [Blattamonas nauphoetae]
MRNQLYSSYSLSVLIGGEKWIEPLLGLNSTIHHGNDGKISTKKFGPQRYEKPKYFEVMGRGFYRMWRPVGSASQIGKTITDFFADRVKHKQNKKEEEEEDLFYDPTAGIENDELFPLLTQTLSILLDANITVLSAILSPKTNLSDDNAIDPWNAFVPALSIWVVGIGVSWVACLMLWLVVDGCFCVWCCLQSCRGCARCCNCCCQCCRNRRPICTFGCYDMNGPKKMWIQCSKIIWTILTAGSMFGAIVTIVAASTIPIVVSKLSGLYDNITDFPPSVASRVMPPLVNALPTALAHLSTIASDVDSDTLPLLNVWDQLFRLNRLLRTDDVFDLQSPYDYPRSLYEFYELPILKEYQNFTFTADIVPCDAFEGEVTLTNIQMDDSIQSTLHSQFYDLATLSLSMNDEKYSQDHPEQLQDRIEDLRLLNSYQGSASHASDITSAKSLLSTFKENIFSRKFLDDIMDTFNHNFEIGTTYTRTAESNKCFTDLEDFKNSVASAVPGPAAYDSAGPVVKRARNLA